MEWVAIKGRMSMNMTLFKDIKKVTKRQKSIDQILTDTGKG